MKIKFYKRIRSHKAIVASLIVIFFMFFCALFGSLIAPDSSENANAQHISLKLSLPMTKVYFLSEIDCEEKRDINHNPEIPIEDSFSIINETIHYRKRGSPYWNQQVILDSQKEYVIQEKTFYLGTDSLGRDVWSRIIVGARTSMLVGFIAVLISLIIGSVLGMLSGYYGGIMDKFILWIINVFWAVPTVLFAMVLLTGYRGESKIQIWIIFIAVGLTIWVDTARIIRGLFLSLKEQQFVEAAKSLGYSDFRIICKHIFPNTFSTLIVITAGNFASAILMESGLSYLGLGVQPPCPSWGSMLREYYNYLGTEVSYLAIFPGICIMLAVVSFYTLGNGLRDVLDVKAT